MEYMNPLSSVKDRLALGIILDAEKKGALKPGQTIVEATSGNTGIALAMVCAVRGYPLVITMADSFSVERRRIMRMLGAKVILTPAAQRGTGMVKKARELAAEHGFFQVSQFENEANAEFHANTTGPEILSDFAGKRLDYWVTGYGTGGTVSGAGRVIRAARGHETKIILSEPAVAPLVSSGEAQEREDDGSPSVTHAAFTPHPIQGWTPDFIPKITAGALDAGIVDEVMTVAPEVAIATSKQLARTQGIFAGISAGASVATALQVAEKAAPGSVILTMLPDTAERYLSTPLFGDIAADMDDDELALSKSTPGYQIAEE